MQAVSFLKEVVSNPQEIGAIAPSSAELGRALADSIDWSRVRVLAEYGPGLGSVTEAILERLEGREFFAIELNESYARSLQERFPDVRVYNESAANLPAILKSRGIERIDAVISSLPWVLFSDELQQEILDTTRAALEPDGQFATFGYAHTLLMPSRSRFRSKLEATFRDVSRSRIYWRNLPPAFTYRCKL